MRKPNLDKMRRTVAREKAAEEARAERAWRRAMTPEHRRLHDQRAREPWPSLGVCEICLQDSIDQMSRAIQRMAAGHA